MCHFWQNPVDPQAEVSLATLEKIPSGIDYLNLTGGEPTLRADLSEIIDLLHPRAMKLKSSNIITPGDRHRQIIRRYTDLNIGLGLKGIGETRNGIRGYKSGSEDKVRAIRESERQTLAV